ncbi:uncharacterized protein BT62DRAFT_1006136 [Guyanagaster necrorhizus]|uniref:Uncharacterized protein n=1 Tax=Guyanagaster necrorhizus TaxID=856835 RepID=A0A9P8ASG8_9AGAR|nr:uncharacterized protein BT62DRAFT_1006136 [Guyanagaster necrorhizus MCA 3950]KAG7445956.1 hypothetical protein BT62DRAFT_1006136 [Guyanagaster necrorhizus MCA 3950]
MNFNSTNINDAAGVKALLDTLQASQAWQQAIATSTENKEAPPQAVVESPSSSSSASSSVAALLAQLQRPQPPAKDPSTFDGTRVSPKHNRSSAFSSPAEDTRSFTFQQALPRIVQLSQDSKFIEKIAQIKKEQDVLERQLWEERGHIQSKYDEKVKNARTRANVIGSDISKHEADMLCDAHRKELLRFDTQRALPLWDNLVREQQERLGQAGVPAMYATAMGADRERQQRIIQVLEGLIGPGRV